MGGFFEAAYEPGPALWPPWLPGREMCFPGALPSERERVALVNLLPCPWREATSALSIWLLVPAPGYHIQRALELWIPFVVMGNSEVFAFRFCHISVCAGFFAIVSTYSLLFKTSFIAFFENRWVWVETINMRPLIFAFYWKFKCLPILSDVTGRIRSAGGD